MSAVRPVFSSRVVSAALAGFLSLLPGAAAVARPEPVADGPFTLTIFHTNDIHAGFDARPAGDEDRLVGGFAALAGHLVRERAGTERSVLLDGGDFMTGNPLCELVVDGRRGGALAALMGAVGYDAGVVGNHEFDLGRAAAIALAAAFPYPLLAVDLVDRADGRPLFATGPLVLERDGLRIGVLGVSCAELADVCTPSRLAGAVSRDQQERLRAQLATLVPGTDVQVLISHNGVDPDRVLAGALAADGLDVIVGAHSHTRLAEPVVESGVLIVQAGSGLRHLGRLDLRLADGQVTHYRGRLIELTAAAAAAAAPAVRGRCADYARRVQAEYGRTIGELADELRRHGGRESALGDWLCDVLRDHVEADVCLVNSGGIRQNLAAGPVTRLDIYEVLPFGNTLVVHTMTGASLRTIVAANVLAAERKSYGILQVSGLSYRHRGPEVRAIRVGGRPLDDRRTYRVAMPDFLSSMRGVYLGGADLGAVEETRETLTDIVIAALERSTGPVKTPEAGRIVSESE